MTAIGAIEFDFDDDEFVFEPLANDDNVDDDDGSSDSSDDKRALYRLLGTVYDTMGPPPFDTDEEWSQIMYANTVRRTHLQKQHVLLPPQRGPNGELQPKPKEIVVVTEVADVDLEAAGLFPDGDTVDDESD